MHAMGNDADARRRRTPPLRLLVPLLCVALFRVSDVVRFSLRSGQYDAPGAASWEEWALTGARPPKVKTLVVTQLPPVKSEHYNLYLGPSWRRLMEDRRRDTYDTSTERVHADLFIACTQHSCDQIDRQYCNLLNVTGDHSADQMAWTNMLEHRAPGELLCYYAPVPEKTGETYKFAHSLNFLEMEPFVSLMQLNYYEYVLRTDADAVLFSGLLHVKPTGSGMVGHGYYGENVTNHIVRHFAETLLPDLGEPFREAFGPGATPSMQSTLYIRADLVAKFVATLLQATRTLHNEAFERGACKKLEQLEVVQQFKQSYILAEGKKPPVGPKKTWICMWPFWMKGTSSLYATRIAVDYVLENVTVTSALDALSTKLSFGDQPAVDVIQSHVLGLKHNIKESFGPGDSTICVAPNQTLKGLRSRILASGELGPNHPMLGILDAIETVAYSSTTPVPSTIYHRIAEIVLHHYVPSAKGVSLVLSGGRV
ncbi:hypothetical protein ACHAXT_005425 [Thalassiosira profunda]